MINLIKFLDAEEIGKYKENIKLSSISTFKAGGTSPLLIYPGNVAKLILLLKYLNRNNINYKVIGNASNIVFNDGDIKLVLIKLDELNNLLIKDTKIVVGAGYSLWKLATMVSKMGLTGLEFATGIPGSIGGAIYMNAGAYKADMNGIVSEIKVVDENFEVKTIKNSDLNYGYRSSILQSHKSYICVEATLNLNHGDINSISNLIEDRKNRRIASQPLEYPSAGSVFRNPENDFAGRLIEEAGLKGYQIGGAEVSLKHANFIINSNKATGNNIRDLIMLIHDKILDKDGVDLKIEQEFVGWE